MTREPPKVTGLAPNAGPPGTKLTIRGENFGTGVKDLIGLTICGKDCLLSAEWKSPAKIICRSGAGTGKGDVIITTKSGGVGSCTVQFRGFMETIGLVKESAVWVDESLLINPVFARKRATSPSQLHPIDPLELSDEHNEEKFPEEELIDMFPEGSGDLRIENFVPAWFLLENHNGTSFDDLKSGLNCLKRKVGQHQEGPLSFLKANVQPIMDCLDTLSNLKNTIESYQHETEEQSLEKLEAAIVKSKDGAVELFEEVLKRKDHADATRNALNVMQRFKFLFHLPCNIERNIKKGDYSVVINDYARVKSLFANTNIQVFRKVYEEVEEKIDGLRKMLRSKLRTLPNNLEDQKKIIKCLVDLETSGDPAWECIQHQYNCIGDLVKQCRDSYLDQVLNEKSEDSEQPLGRQTLKDSIFTKSGEDCDVKPPIRVKFVTTVSEVFSDNFPDLWKLGQAYFTGKLLLKEDGNSSGRVDPVKQEAYKRMILESLRFYCSLIRAALLPHTLNILSPSEAEHYGIWPENDLETIGSWIPQCLRCVRSCYLSLIRLNLPGDALDITQSLILDLRVHSMVTLFHQVIEDISSIHMREDWVLEIDDENGGLTQLPLLFENTVIEKLQLIKESVLHTGVREEEIFVAPHVQNIVKQMTTKLLVAFTSSLDTLASQKDNTHAKIKDINGSISVGNMNENVPTRERCLLIILSNCNYAVSNILTRLPAVYKKNGYPDVTRVVKAATSNYFALDQKVFEAYIEQKCDPIIGTIEQNMYAGKFDWNECRAPKGARNFIKLIIMDIIAVHSEVYSVSPNLVKRVMTRIVELVAEEVARLFSFIPKFSTAGTLQARLDVFALQDVLSIYQTPGSSNHFKDCLTCLPLLDEVKDKQRLETLLKEFQNQMRFQLLCFQRNISVS